MPFKMFTNAVEGHVDESIAINPDQIINVFERVTTVATAEGNKEKKVAAGKPKPKVFKTNVLDDDIDDLDSKYYFKNKFD